MNIERISDAIAVHGAAAVHAAAVARMDGDRRPLDAVGLSASTIGDADRVLQLTFAAMSSPERAGDLAAAAIKAAQVGR